MTMAQDLIRIKHFTRAIAKLSSKGVATNYVRQLAHAGPQCPACGAGGSGGR